MSLESLRSQMMTAASAARIPEARRGLWRIQKIDVTIPGLFPECGLKCPVGDYTTLRRLTDATLLNGGETVMADNPIELRKHLGFAVAARGRVLVSGLGLACVVRMLQRNPEIERITILEICQDVIDLVWPHTSHRRCELIHEDAFEFLSRTRRRFDCAWHDIWTDMDNGQPHLQVAHAKLMLACVDRVSFQGAWEFPRTEKRRWNAALRERRSKQAV